MRNFINKKDVEKELANKNVQMAEHPVYPQLKILNYTKKAQFEQNWNDTTMACRGLVVDWDYSPEQARVVIRSPKKFFNRGEPLAPNPDDWKSSDVYVSEKLDGYYISIRDDSTFGLIVTSRGSFDSIFAQAARELLPPSLPKNTDFFCELCQDFPGQESIIVAKHPVPRLVCWGVNGTVPTEDAPHGWTGQIAKRLTLREAEDYLRGEEEGVVLFNLSTGERVKVKTAWYIAAHRLISHCTFKDTLQIVSTGGKIAGQRETFYTDVAGNPQRLIVENLPEEHLEQMCVWEKQIRDTYKEVVTLADEFSLEYLAEDKKTIALAKEIPQDIKSILFSRLNKKDTATKDRILWGVIKNRLLRDSTDQ